MYPRDEWATSSQTWYDLGAQFREVPRCVRTERGLKRTHCDSGASVVWAEGFLLHELLASS